MRLYRKHRACRQGASFQCLSLIGLAAHLWEWRWCRLYPDLKIFELSLVRLVLEKREKSYQSRVPVFNAGDYSLRALNTRQRIEIFKNVIKTFVTWTALNPARFFSLQSSTRLPCSLRYKDKVVEIFVNNFSGIQYYGMRWGKNKLALELMRR